MSTLYSRMMHYWELACRYDGLTPDINKIYVFSAKNPYRIPFQVLSRLYWSLPALRERIQKDVSID